MIQEVLAFDLGGTKIAAGVVNSRGKVIDQIREPANFAQGKKAVLDQMAQLGKKFLKGRSKIRRIGIATAGPLDPVRGLLLNPTNFASGGKHWGTVPMAKILGERLGKTVIMENDAAAAILAEAWIGAAKGYNNAMILTLGTGLGTGIIANGQLVRAGRSLHPEAGHMIIDYNDPTAICGCGNLGCAEALLSGNGFARRAGVKLGIQGATGKEIADLARNGDAAARECFDEYARLMATAIHNYVAIYAPEIVVFTGSFAQASDLFLAQTKRYLKPLLACMSVGINMMPKLAHSSLNNQAGLIGGAWVALQKKK